MKNWQFFRLIVGGGIFAFLAIIAHAFLTDNLEAMSGLPNDPTRFDRVQLDITSRFKERCAPFTYEDQVLEWGRITEDDGMLAISRESSADSFIRDEILYDEFYTNFEDEADRLQLDRVSFIEMKCFNLQDFQKYLLILGIIFSLSFIAILLMKWARINQPIEEQ